MYIHTKLVGPIIKQTLTIKFVVKNGYRMHTDICQLLTLPKMVSSIHKWPSQLSSCSKQIIRLTAVRGRTED